MKPHIVRFVHSVRSASRLRALTENTSNKWGIRSTFLCLSLITRLQPDTLGGPKISMMVATDSFDRFLLLWQGEKGGQDDYVMQSFQNYIDRLGLVRAELECDQEPSILDVASALIERCQSTILMATATPKGSKGSLGRSPSKFDNSGTASSIS